ncbi:MAG: pitrilysin family protein, partial [Anaerovoracaceae bacterium]
IKDTPDEDAHDTICELVFKDNPLGKSIIGTTTTLKRISREVLMDYIDQQYTKDSIVVSVAGNFQSELVEEIIAGRLDGLKEKKNPVEYPEETYVPSFKVKVKDIEQTHLCLATRSVSLADPRYYAFALLNNIMGGSMSSRFFQNIREQKGLAYSVYSMNSAFTQNGYYNIYAGVSHDKIKDTIAAIKEELSLLKEHGVTADELAKAKEQLKSAYIFGQENVNGRMFAIGKTMTLQGRIYTPEEVMHEIDKVTLEDIGNVAEIICDIQQYSGVAVTDRRIDLRKMIQG